MNLSFKNMNISKKLPIYMIALAIINCLILSIISDKFATENIYSLAEDKVTAIADIKEDSFKDYLNAIENEIIINANNGYTKQAIKDFSSAWSMISGNPTEYLKSQYLPANIPAADRINIMKANDGSLYSEFHGRYHPFFKDLLERQGYYDIFLLDTKGNLVYSVFKEADYATNMYSGEWKNTDIANAYKSALKKQDGEISFYDFKSYAPSYGVPASFMSVPVTDDRSGSNIGVLIFQMPIDTINNILRHTDTAGETSKNILVGRDGVYRNNPYLEKDGRANNDVILKEKIDLSLVNKAFETGKETHGKTDKYIYSADPLSFHGTDYAVLSFVERTEVQAPVTEAQHQMLLYSIAVLIGIALVSIFVSKSISNPLSRQVAIMEPLSKGDFSVEVADQDKGDEIGDIARAVQAFKENGIRVKQLEAQQVAQKVKAEQDKKESQVMLANDFDSRVGGVITSLSDSAHSMTTVAQQMQMASQQTAEVSSTVASAATEADSNVQTVAAASEELAASSSEIARQIDAVAKKSSAAASDAQATSESVNELNTLADSIGEVIGTIKDIAEQTNLLALNATIEAARAGEAGKGFAVVADEVKKLANETATKTEEIDERVNKIQEAIRQSVSAMDKIISNVSEIDAATTTVASAVEEQNAATAEIGRNVTEASTGTQQVSQSIIQVQQNAAESGEASSSVLHSASELKSQSDILRDEVEKFLNEIREGGSKTVTKDNDDGTVA
jgi:methyl-accepting chemotaxis protein